LLLSILLTTASLLPQQEPDLGGQVRNLFADKCVQCHNPQSDSRKAKRELDQAWDLRAVAREWGDALDPESSVLIEIAEDRSMPPEDSDYLPVTEQEAILLIDWALAGTPMPHDGNPFVDMEMAAQYMPKSDQPAAPPVEHSLWQRALILLGHFHPLVVHFPVAFLLLATLLRCGFLFRKNETCLKLEFICFCVGAPSAIFAAGLGWLNAANSGAGGHDLFLHRWLGVGVAAGAVLMLILHKSTARKKGYSLLVFALAIALAWGAHMGGEMVYGESYLQF